jgi:hypothetical protein
VILLFPSEYGDFLQIFSIMAIHRWGLKFRISGLTHQLATFLQANDGSPSKDSGVLLDFQVPNP